MSFKICEAIFYNIAPFDQLNISFKEKGINVLTGLNGKGKTTIISFIVDAFIEFSKEGYKNEYGQEITSFYRVSSGIFNLNKGLPSLIYIRFKNDENNIDYLNIRGNMTKDQYEKIVPYSDRLAFGDFSNDLNKNRFLKEHTKTEKEVAETLFSKKILTYFPSYRYEIPGFLNKNFKEKIKYTDSAKYNGYLPNPIEVVHSLNNITTWIMDVVLDWYTNKDEKYQLINGKISAIDQTAEKNIWINLNKILTELFKEKSHNLPLRFGIGTRDASGQRLSIVSNTDKYEVFAPNLSVISSGEASIIGIFAEILRQADNLNRNIEMKEIEGIVLIDEIDKHLHMKLQNEVLPKLLNLFPNLQFILTSHSPFLNMGLAEFCKDKSRIFDLDNSGLSCEPEKTVEFENFYNSILQNNENYQVMYNELKVQTENLTKPLIFTEGKTDWKHFKKSLQLLQDNNEFTDIDVNFLEYSFENGDSKLNAYLENVCKTPHPNKIIGIFDCDEANGKKYSKLENGIKDFDNNVFSLSIPIPDFRNGMNGISVEFLYSDDDLKQLDSNHRRIYTTDEFNENGRLISDISIGLKNADKLKEAHRIRTPKIVDSEVISNEGDSKALSKNCFANNILNGIFTINELSGFKAVFEKLRIILNQN